MSTHRGDRGVEPLVAEGCNQSLTQAAVKVKGLLSMHVYTYTHVHQCPFIYVGVASDTSSVFYLQWTLTW